MLQLAWIWILLALPLPLVVALTLPRVSDERRAALRVPFFGGVQPDEPGVVSRRPSIRLLLAALAWLALVLAAARPQWVGEVEQLPATGRDLLLAVDISGSMKAEDLSLGGVAVNRLDVVKSVAGEFVTGREGDRVGLILFGTRAYLQAPLTFDLTSVRKLLEDAAIGLAGERTAIGDAIGLAVKRLRQRPESNRVLVLLTDGANTAGALDPARAAELAALEALRVYTIGVGSDEMTVQDFFGTRRVNPSAELDEGVLREIASATGGQYFRARDTEGLQNIYEQLDMIESIDQESRAYRPVEELFPWPLGLALVLAALASWLGAVASPSRAGPAAAGPG